MKFSDDLLTSQCEIAVENSKKADRPTALVTGASKGIGRGIATGLAAAGWDIAVNYFHDEAGAKATAAAVESLGSRAWMLQADIGQSSQVSHMFSEFSKLTSQLDLLVNNAGVQTWSPLLDLAEENWDRTIRTNLKGTFLCTQAAGRMMKETGGCIINIGSGANKTPYPCLSDYCASKGGIENLTAVAAVELGQYNIRVNCVAPGSIEIERTQDEDPTYKETWARLTPLGMVGKAQDVAEAVVYFSSEKSRFVTGQTLYIDGGLWTSGPWPYDVKDQD